MKRAGSRSPLTYVYGLVAAPRRPSRRILPAGLPGAGPVRLLPLADGERSGVLRTWLVVADVPAVRYGESAIVRGLKNLDWVARAAVAHEAVIEAFVTTSAAIPMKLFTLFETDERALAAMRQRQQDINGLLRRVADHQEWAVRLHGDPRPAVAPVRGKMTREPLSGAGYLTSKRAHQKVAVSSRDRASNLAEDLFGHLSAVAGEAIRRAASEWPSEGTPPLLDAAFLVARRQLGRFKARVEREARTIRPHGLELVVSGPWPPYSFI